MKEVTIYTDGACSGNPGKGGWCAILNYKGVEKVLSGGERETTNNRMELTAVIRGLAALKEPCKVSVYSDSAYVVNAVANDWLSDWKRRNWHTASRSEVKNVELWEELTSLLAVHTVKLIKVKGHADNELNNRCDALARAAIDRLED
ncbi:MAG: ribonuclease HI [Clostridia bacterium]|nr:ribonuclease HI [Clostridia bacterium]